MLRRVRGGGWARFTSWTLVTVLFWLFGPNAVVGSQIEEGRHRDIQSQGHSRRLSVPEKQAIRGRATQPGAPKPWQYSSSTLGGYGTWNLFTGNHTAAIPVVSWGGKGGGVSFVLYHNSAATQSGFPAPKPPIANGWSHTYHVYLNGAGTSSVTVVEGDGTKTTFTQNVDGSFTAPAGVYDTLVRNPNLTYTLTRKHGLKLNFGSNNKLATIVDLNNNTVTLAYNGAGHVSTVTDAAGRVLTLGYNGSNELTSVTDPLSRVFALSYTGLYDLYRVTYPAPAMGQAQPYFEFSYVGNNGTLSTFKNRRGSVWTLYYETADVQKLTKVTDPAAKSRSINPTLGIPLMLENGSNYSWTSDGNGNLTSLTLNGNFMFPPETKSWTWDSQHNKLTQVTGGGHTWEYTYDSKGNVLTVEDPITRTNANVVKETYTYNNLNLPLTRTDALNHTWSFAYDVKGNLTQETDPLNAVTSHSYSTAGEKLSTTDPRSKIWQWSYDTYGNAVTAKDPYLNTVTTTFNTLGWPTSITTPGGITESLDYDTLGRLTRTTHEDASYAEQTFDAEDAVLSATDENGKTAAKVYNSRGWVTSVTDAKNQTTSFGYDDLGQRTSLTNARNKTTTWTLDLAGRPVDVDYPDGTSEQTTYNADGLTATRTDGRGYTVRFSYDDVGRMTAVDYPTGTDTSNTYLANDLRSTMTDRTGTYTWTFNSRNAPVTEATPTGTISRTFDAAGNVLTVSRSGGGTQTFVYDDAGRKTSITNGANETTTLAYDTDSRISQQTFSTGAKVIPTYSAQRGWLTAIDHKKANNTLISRFEYTRDVAGHLTATAQPGVYSTSYTYDNVYQLLSETRTGTSAYSYSYTYDAAGNRLTKTNGGSTENYTYGDNNQLLTAGTKSYTYDNNGNLTQVNAGGQLTNLTWDYNNKLTQLVSPGGTQTYSTNDLGLRVSKTAGTTTNYLFNGDQVLADTRADYTRGGLIGLISERSGATSRFYHGDGQGSTRKLTDTGQNTTDTREFDVWGLTIASTGSNATPFGFIGGQGYQTDSSGLMLLGARYYDPSTGRFVNRDPLRYGGDVNLYRYCGNDPASKTDPTGLASYPSEEYWREINRLAQRIENISRKIEERLLELVIDRQELPWRLPGDDVTPSISVRGHEDILIPKDKANLEKRTWELYEKLPEHLRGPFQEWIGKRSAGSGAGLGAIGTIATGLEVGVDAAIIAVRYRKRVELYLDEDGDWENDPVNRPQNRA